MNIEILAQPRFAIPLTQAHVQVLLRLSGAHYDGVCRQASHVGGFIYGWNNVTEWSPDLPVLASWREIDTTLKICEIRHALWPEPNNAIDDLVRSLRLALKLWPEASKDWHVSTEKYENSLYAGL